MTDNYNQAPWIKMPIEELTTPRAGKICYGPRWWAVTEDGCVLFFRTYGSPQCNIHQSVVEKIRPDCRAVFIEMTFLAHNCSDYAQ